MKNILESFLDALEVRYTKKYADSLYDEHPHRDNMYGLKRMLNIFGIKTIGAYLKDKNPKHLTYPCILHIPNDFIIGLDTDGENITYLSHGKKVTETINAFKEAWTGNALVVEDAINPQEKKKKKHQCEQLQFWSKTLCIPIALFIIIVSCSIRHVADYTYLHFVYSLFSLLGVIICILLLQKQLFGESRYGDKVCTLFHQADCNGILNDSHAKCLGISWSEIGMGYFVANILLLLSFPTSIYCVTIICWLAMCFGVWSIYYQWHVVHKWCVLCVLVQVIVWIMGAAAVIISLPLPSSYDIFASILSCFAFIICIMLVHLYVSLYLSEKDRKHSEQQYRALKANRTVAQALIEASEYHEITTNDSSILFGNPEARMRITVLSNPHCGPCALAHEQIEQILNLCGDDVCVQYVLTFFNPSLENSCRYLISCYDAKDMDSTRKYYTDWYAKGKYEYKKLIKENADKLYDARISAELNKHLSWRKKAGFTATPTILVNGYVLPKTFSITDLSMIV